MKIMRKIYLQQRIQQTQYSVNHIISFTDERNTALSTSAHNKNNINSGRGQKTVNTNTPANQQPGTNQESELGRQVPGL
jgi:hypothetical protein